MQFINLSLFLPGNLGTYQERSKARELTDNDIKVLLSLELPQGGLGAKSGIMGPGAGVGVGNGSGGTKSKGVRNDDVDSSIPKVHTFILILFLLFFFFLFLFLLILFISFLISSMRCDAD